MEYDLVKQSCRLLGYSWPCEEIHVESMTPDGSLRRFCRLIRKDGSRRIAVAPPVGDAAGMQEAVAGWEIGRHLFNCGAPVPELFAFDQHSGLQICEDLGDVRLHDLIITKGCSAPEVREYYQQAVVELARMQVHGRKNFDCSWCWDTPQYDRKLMLERESGYFLQALCIDMLQLSVTPQDIEQEFAVLADRAAQADAGFFLHRDFQSRNIMVHNGQAHFIDYQAGRLGPAGYDLASLLIDPYAALPQEMQEELFELYLAEFVRLTGYNRQRFTKEYQALALQRNLQILGAFAFLSHQRGKIFFSQYIKPSLLVLSSLLDRIPPAEFTYLRRVQQQCLAEI